MEIGKPVRELIVEPLELPEPLRVDVPAEKPAEAPVEWPRDWSVNRGESKER